MRDQIFERPIAVAIPKEETEKNKKKNSKIKRGGLKKFSAFAVMTLAPHGE